MTGHRKLRPLVLETSWRFASKVQNIEDYDLMKTILMEVSWMTTEICKNSVQELDKLMDKQHHIIALIFDIPNEKTEMLVFYLPPNVTSKLQSLDQGVIKMCYHKRRA